MHLPDGYLSPPVWAALDGVGAVAFLHALKRAERSWEPRRVPLMGITAAFIFVAQMLNFPITGGTSGHLLGAVLATALVGPWCGALVTGVVVAIQALFFADGGILALGANWLNMGWLGAVGVGGIWWGWQRAAPRWALPGLAVAAWLAVVLGATATAVEIALSGVMPFRLVGSAMIGIHALIGLGEAFITVAAYFLLASLGRVPTGEQESKAPPSPLRRWLRIGALLLGAILLAPFASQLPDGLEWVAERLGFAGREAEPLVAAPLPDYTLPGLGEGPWGVWGAALVGVVLVVLVLWALGALGRGMPSPHLEMPWEMASPHAPLRRWDARVKGLGMMAYLLALLLAPHWEGARALAFALVLVPLWAASGVPVGFGLRRWLGLLPFLLIAALGTLLRGDWQRWGSLVGRASLALLALLLFLGCTPPSELLTGLRRLGAPRPFVELLGMTLRYLPLLLEEGVRMYRAYSLRHPRPASLRDASTLGRLVGTLFLRAYERAERVYAAMLARGYRGAFPSLRSPASTWGQWAGVVVFALVMVALAVMP